MTVTIVTHDNEVLDSLAVLVVDLIIVEVERDDSEGGGEGPQVERDEGEHGKHVHLNKNFFTSISCLLSDRPSMQSSNLLLL